MPSVFDLLHTSIKKELLHLGIVEPTPPQEKVIPPILAGENVLLVAPTASGKTEAAILPVFDLYLRHGDSKGICIIYITPLRALNRDINKRMMVWAESLGIDVQIRHSDTSQKERRSQLKKPPQMLITTPETLQAIIPTQTMQQYLSHVRWVIIDEIHDLAASKRGAQLTVGLERLEEMTHKPFQRIGLSATVGNPDVVASFLGGHHPVKIIEVEVDKTYRYDVEYPTPKDEDFDLSQDLNTTPLAASRLRYIRDLVRQHRSTLIFVQGRGQAESLGHKLGMLDGSVEVHHGSLSREQRHLVEDRFKTGELKAIVATSTLQLGIDIGEVDLAVQYNSPRQVSTLIQRVGRAGHKLSRTSQGILIASYGEDAMESLVTAFKAKRNEIEPTEIHIEPLDVLAHQITGMTLDCGEIGLDKVLDVLKRAYPFRNLQFSVFEEVVGFLNAIKIVNRREDNLVKTKKGQKYYFENLGMINDEKRYPFINVVTDKIIGTVGDEFWTLRARIGLNVILRGRVWKILQIDEDEGRLYVIQSDDPLGALPGWDGELIGVTQSIAENVGDLREKIAKLLNTTNMDSAVTELSASLGVSRATIEVAANEVKAQLSQGFPLPNKDLILVESYDRYLIIHTTYGSKVNATLGCILDAILSEKDLIIGWWNDAYRILIEAPQKITRYDLDEVMTTIRRLSPDEAEKYLDEFMEARFPYAYNMKYIAERFGAIPRGKTYGLDALNRLYKRYRNSPIYKETLREIYKEKIDLSAIKGIAAEITELRIIVQVIQSKEPSPLARHILEAYTDIGELMDTTATGMDQLDYMRKSTHARLIEVSCMSCNQWSNKARIREFQDRPKCSSCGSQLLAVMKRNQEALSFQALYDRWMSSEQLLPEDIEAITYGRKTADIVLSHGKRALEALAIYGVGPVTAYQILSRMHKTEKEFYADLLKAKIQYMRNRQFWDERKDKMR